MTQPHVHSPQHTDPELISRVREGDVAAYGILFSRHVESATRLARLLIGASDADDLVSEAFVKVLNVLLGGGGPDVAFRAYLLTAVRRLHLDKMRSNQRLTTTDDLTPFDPGVPFTDTAIAGFEGGAAAKAFASLPERWQLVLWHLEVENQKPAEIAPLLGMTPNSVSALAYRAREGLRQAFLTMHAGDLVNDACKETNGLLGGYVRNALSRRDGTRVENHLEGCRRCTAVYLELKEVNSSLAAVLGPILLGPAAAAYIGGGAATGIGTGLLLLLGRGRDVVVGHVSASAATAAVVGVAGITGATVVQRGPQSEPAAAQPPAQSRVLQEAPAPTSPEASRNPSGDPARASAGKSGATASASGAPAPRAGGVLPSDASTVVGAPLGSDVLGGGPAGDETPTPSVGPDEAPEDGTEQDGTEPDGTGTGVNQPGGTEPSVAQDPQTPTPTLGSGPDPEPDPQPEPVPEPEPSPASTPSEPATADPEPDPKPDPEQGLEQGPEPSLTPDPRESRTSKPGHATAGPGQPTARPGKTTAKPGRPGPAAKPPRGRPSATSSPTPQTSSADVGVRAGRATVRRGHILVTVQVMGVPRGEQVQLSASVNSGGLRTGIGNCRSEGAGYTCTASFARSMFAFDVSAESKASRLTLQVTPPAGYVDPSSSNNTTTVRVPLSNDRPRGQDEAGDTSTGNGAGSGANEVEQPLIGY
jgi:RNA polymerase sigma factor (sigma-70 family)